MSKFAANTLWLISGDVLGMTISFATMPIITNLYTPTDFGVFSVIISVLAILGPVSTLRFNEVIILSKDEKQSWNSTALSCITCIAFVCVLGGIWLLLSSAWLSIALNIGAYREYLWIIPFGVLLRGFFLSLNQLAEWQEKFKQVALTPILSNLSGRSLAIGLGFLSIGAWGLICGRLSGLFVAVLYLLFLTLRGEVNSMLRAISLMRLKEIATRYKDFPIFGPWSILLHTAAREILVFLLVSLFSPAIAGLYALSNNMVHNPLSVIGLSLNRVFRQKAIRIKEDHELLIFETKRFFGYLLILILPIILILFALGDRIFFLVFGGEWQEAGIYVQILAPALFFIFLYTTMRAFFIILEKPRQRLISDICYFSVRAISLLSAGLVTQSPRLSLLFLSICTSIFVFCFLIYIAAMLKVDCLFFVKLIIMKFVTMTPLIGGLAVIRYLLVPEITLSIMVLLLSLVLQVIVIVSSDLYLKKTALKFLYEKTKNPFFEQR